MCTWYKTRRERIIIYLTRGNEIRGNKRVRSGDTFNKKRTWGDTVQITIIVAAVDEAVVENWLIIVIIIIVLTTRSKILYTSNDNNITMRICFFVTFLTECPFFRKHRENFIFLTRTCGIRTFDYKPLNEY